MTDAWYPLAADYWVDPAEAGAQRGRDPASPPRDDIHVIHARRRDEHADTIARGAAGHIEIRTRYS